MLYNINVVIDVDVETFGKRLARLRKEYGLTQKGLADIVGLTHTAINYYEKDKRNPDNISIIRDIAVALETTASYMLGLDEDNGSVPITYAAQRIARAYERADTPVKRTVEVALEPYMDKPEKS